MPMALALQLCHCSFLGIFYNLCLSVPASAYGGRLRLALLACCLASLLSRELAVRLTAASALAATSEATANVKGVEEEVISRLLTLRNCISYSLKLHFQRFCKILEYPQWRSKQKSAGNFKIGENAFGTSQRSLATGSYCGQRIGWGIVNILCIFVWNLLDIFEFSMNGVLVRMMRDRQMMDNSKRYVL